MIPTLKKSRFLLEGILVFADSLGKEVFKSEINYLFWYSMSCCWVRMSTKIARLVYHSCYLSKCSVKRKLLLTNV